MSKKPDDPTPGFLQPEISVDSRPSSVNLTTTIASYSFNQAFPDAASINALESHYPGSSKILMTAFESQVSHRQEMERSTQKEQSIEAGHKRYMQWVNLLLGATFVLGPVVLSAIISRIEPLWLTGVVLAAAIALNKKTKINP